MHSVCVPRHLHAEISCFFLIFSSDHLSKQPPHMRHVSKGFGFSQPDFSLDPRSRATLRLLFAGVFQTPLSSVAPEKHTAAGKQSPGVVLGERRAGKGVRMKARLFLSSQEGNREVRAGGQRARTAPRLLQPWGRRTGGVKGLFSFSAPIT